ncbi:MAG: hypothetical protein J6Z43_02710 [Clostridiales bacterium]|nr:hypothetical protein [Clostridiales bacterium]
MTGKQRAFWILGFALIGVAAGLIILYAILHYENYYCTDEIPDTPNIFVYDADCFYGTLNRTYTGYKDLEAGDAFRMIGYDDIPDIAAIDGVEGFYIFDDVKIEDFFNYDKSQGMLEMSVPQDIINYFGDESAMSSMFITTFGSGPADGSNGICLPQSEITARLNAAIGSTIDYKGSPMVLTGINNYEFAWLPFDEEKSLIYVYDPDTYEDFAAKIKLFCLREEVTSNVRMMIICDPDKSVQIQDYLITTYPASNYQSREFSRVFKASMNSAYWKSVGKFALADIIIAAVVVVPMLVYAKKKDT